MELATMEALAVVVLSEAMRGNGFMASLNLLEEEMLI
jgi:hypothetical protein